LLLLGFVVFLLVRQKTRLAGFAAMLAWPVANACTDVIKATWPMPRPPVALSDVMHRVEGGMGNGTASAHSANMMAIAIVFGVFGHKGLFCCWLVIALLTGISRIYNGVHFPYQVLFGWGVGAFVAWLVSITLQAGVSVFSRRKLDENQEPEHEMV
jgi:undecaprenyl-diphosphatase